MHLRVTVEPAAIQAGRKAVHAAVINLAAGWTFLDRSRAVEAARDFSRIGAYHLERGRLRLLGRRPIALAQHTPKKETPAGLGGIDELDVAMSLLVEWHGGKPEVWPATD